ncbi:MAG TPA: galactokinase [Acidobacteriaceae bacterium]|nr:galactokinase [Acidobacteriaceae bacterium]
MNSAQFFAPARINLLGEHTDYTGGFVLPMAINFATVAEISPRSDARYGFSSKRFPETFDIAVDDRSPSRGVWSDYPVGVLRMLQDRGIEPPPFDLSLGGDVPLNSGLSSSASVEVASAVAMLAHSGVTLSAKEIALLCQRAENDYVHSPCGIMDQFVVTAGHAGHAMLLDTRALTYDLLPLFPGTHVVVCNSMVKHSIATGEYGVRRREVEAGQTAVRAAFPHIPMLRDASIADLEGCRNKMSPESFKRCRHIISDNGRALAARDVMTSGDSVQFGQLLLSAHASQRDDFACSCDEIDFLVDTAATLDGCFGARMTGGGFGGCTVNLVKDENAENFAAELRKRYLERFNIHADTFVAEPVDGALLRNARALAEVAEA